MSRIDHDRCPGATSTNHQASSFPEASLGTSDKPHVDLPPALNCVVAFPYAVDMQDINARTFWTVTQDRSDRKMCCHESPPCLGEPSGAVRSHARSWLDASDQGEYVRAAAEDRAVTDDHQLTAISEQEEMILDRQTDHDHLFACNAQSAIPRRGRSSLVMFQVYVLLRDAWHVTWSADMLRNADSSGHQKLYMHPIGCGEAMHSPRHQEASRHACVY